MGLIVSRPSTRKHPNSLGLEGTWGVSLSLDLSLNISSIMVGNGEREREWKGKRTKFFLDAVSKRENGREHHILCLQLLYREGPAQKTPKEQNQTLYTTCWCWCLCWCKNANSIPVLPLRLPPLLFVTVCTVV